MPHLPPGMFDLILDRAAVALPRVTPVVLENESLSRVGRHLHRRTFELRSQAVPPSAESPAVLTPSLIVVSPHGEGTIGLIVESARGPGDGAMRHEFAHKRDPAPPLVTDSPPNVK